MNIKKIAVVVFALVAGGAAFFLTLSGQDSNAPAPVTIVKAEKENTVDVLVAKSEVARGDRLTVDNTQWVEWPEKTVKKSEVFFTGKDTDILEELDGAIFKTTMVPGEPIIEDKIVRADSNGLMAAIMTPGMRAVSVRVTPETSAGGFILPGDHVDIIFTAEERKTKKRIITTLLRDVRVLAVDTQFAENTEEATINGDNVTLEVTPVEAEEFIFARASGELSLALRSIHDDQPADRSRDANDVQQTKVKIIRIGRT